MGTVAPGSWGIYKKLVGLGSKPGRVGASTRVIETEGTTQMGLLKGPWGADSPSHLHSRLGRPSLTEHIACSAIMEAELPGRASAFP